MKNILIFSFIVVMFSCSSDDTNNQSEITVTTSDFETTIDEHPLQNQVLGFIEGSTNQGSVTFSILNQSADSAMFINSTTGELSVNNYTHFQFRTNPIITGTIKVANGSHFKLAQVTINLNNVDNQYIGYGSWTLYSQEQVDHFGQIGYTEVTEALYIEYNSMFGSPITSLLPLINLTKIGYLDIKNNYQLTSLEGLNNLEIVDTSFFLYANTSLTNLNGLNNLISVEGTFHIGYNSNLENLDGLNNLINVQGDFSIFQNWALVNIDGLIGLRNVSEDLSVSNNYELFNLCGITTLIENNGILGEYQVGANGYNPTIQDILDGNCQ
ncbi:MAG: hypothetical protein ACK5M1_12380 [Xanthomarina gelatinilytica]|uniref:hypothetical protein n=1 Tax=Xanthomarina gelatinilytica TaxID=1137281 RepID=UPI003A8945F3